MQCPRCFWLDVRQKITRPSTPPFRINQAVDELLKKEFDHYRQKKQSHPIMIEFKVDGIPFAHKDLNTWRENFIGVQYLHKKTNLLIFGAIDDLWKMANGKLAVVDYKATAKDADVSIDADWQIMYKRQLEIYQWLLRQNGFEVQDTGYFVYTNGRLDVDNFADKIEFRTKIISYKGSDKWIESTLSKMKKVMDSDMPEVGSSAMGGDCDYCKYARARTELTIKNIQSAKNKKQN